MTDERNAALEEALADELGRLASLATPAMLAPSASPTAMAALLRLGAKHQRPRGKDWESANYEADGALLNMLAINLPTILAALKSPAQSDAGEGEWSPEIEANARGIARKVVADRKMPRDNGPVYSAALEAARAALYTPPRDERAEAVAGEREACQRCVVLEDLLETATSERDKARDESRKADEETLALKVRDVSKLAMDMTGSYAAIKAFQHRAEAAEAELAALATQPGTGEE